MLSYCLLYTSNKTQEDYFVAKRSLPWLPIGLSIAATMISCNSFVGGPGWGYHSGLLPFMQNMTVPLALFISTTIFVPMLYDLKLTSVYEYIELRLGPKTRMAAVLGFILNSLIQVSSKMCIRDSALYMANTALTALNSLRETFKDSDTVRVHPIITKGGTVVNAIPEEVCVECVCRAGKTETVLDVSKKFDQAMGAGAVSYTHLVNASSSAFLETYSYCLTFLAIFSISSGGNKGLTYRMSASSLSAMEETRKSFRFST